VAGKYKLNSGSDACKCPQNSLSSDGGDNTTSCLCNAGWSGTAEDCVGCLAGKFKPNPGSTACTECEEGFYSEEEEALCKLCPSNALSTMRGGTIKDCLCNAGWSGVNGECEGCVAGKFKPITREDNCTDCIGGGVFSYASASTCINCASVTYTEDDRCSDCVDGTYGSPEFVVIISPLSCQTESEGAYLSTNQLYWNYQVYKLRVPSGGVS